MEEKLYFKPESYGKKKTPKEKREKSEKEDRKILRASLVLGVVVIIILIILWLLRGKTTTTGQYPANVRSESLECITNDIIYEKVNDVDSDDRELKITMVFPGGANFSSASLKYSLNFDTEEEAYRAEALSHAQFNIGLQALGFNAEKFNNKFSLMGKTLIITLGLPNSSTITEMTKSYLLVKTNENGELPSSLEEYRKNYESQGLKCASSLDNK